MKILILVLLLGAVLVMAQLGDTPRRHGSIQTLP